MPVSAGAARSQMDNNAVGWPQVHTTGVDIKHAINACAVVTLGKDMTSRDYFQGCWRMRGIGKGQTVAVVLFPDMLARMHRDLHGFSASAIDDILEWLVLRDVHSQLQQHRQTRAQDIAHLWKRHIFVHELARHDMNSAVRVGPSPVHTNDPHVHPTLRRVHAAERGSLPSGFMKRLGTTWTRRCSNLSLLWLHPRPTCSTY